MDEQSLIHYLGNPDDIKDPEIAQEVLSELSGIITHLQSEELRLRLLASAERNRIAQVQKLSDAKTKTQWELSTQYKDWQEMVLKVKKFGRHRQDINKKYEVICGIKRSY